MTHRLLHFCIGIAVLVRSVSAEPVVEIPPRAPAKTVRGQAVVVCDTPEAARIGRETLQRGGTAVDAAVAVAFALSVTWPEAGNIGGGGFMLVAPPGDEPVLCIDYRETAPAAAERSTFINWEDRQHVLAVGVPGTVHGLLSAHRKYGRLSWDSLVEPAIQLASRGLVVDDNLAYSLNRTLNTEPVKQLDRFAEFRRVYGHPTNYLWSGGDTLRLPDLGGTLAVIAEDSGKSFYHGDLAAAIAAEIKRSGGLINTEDLAQYSSIIRPASHDVVAGFDVYGAPPVSSGGFCVAMQLKMISLLGLNRPTADAWSIDNIHLMTEVMRRTFRERAAYLGDPAFVEVPARLLESKHVTALTDSIDRSKATSSRSIAGAIAVTEPPAESNETTHFSIVDQDGMAVSNTYTLEGRFGSQIVVPETGILLNNEMGDFNWVPGRTTTAGQIGTEPNTVAGGKRMVSSQSPTIIKQNGQVRLVLGSPGGRTIINSVVQVIVQRLFFGRSLVDAVESPRFHHQWFPDVIRMEPHNAGTLERVIGPLKAMGHHVEVPVGYRQGSVNAIEIDPETSDVFGVSDGRRTPGAAVIVTP